MEYKCGCTADGDNVANYCPIHGDALVRSTALLSRPVHPEEYRYRISKFHRSIEQIIQQKLLIENLWPKPIIFEKDSVRYVFNRGERPKEVEELDAYLSESINNAFREIVVEGK